MSSYARKIRRNPASKQALRATTDNLSLAVKYHAVYDAVAGAINPEFLKNVEQVLGASLRFETGVTHSQLFDLTRRAALVVLKTDVPPFAADTPMDGSYGDSANLPLANSDLPVSEDTVSGGAADNQSADGTLPADLEAVLHEQYEATK